MAAGPLKFVDALAVRPSTNATAQGSETQGTAQAVEGGERKADVDQQQVIDAGVGEHMLVQAGPGYGKTDVVCARVAALLETGVRPGELLLLSFTRTAVREMRGRIRALARQGVDTRGVEIRTVDSWVGDLRSGLVSGERAGSFTESIVDVLQLLSGHETPALREELDRYRHVFVDEAQDLVGPRAEVVVKVLQRLNGDAGWTIFADPAQALYDWAEEGTGRAAASFLDVLRGSRLAYRPHELNTLHRTANPELKTMLQTSRRIVLDEKEPDRAGKLRNVLIPAGTPAFVPEQLPALVQRMGPSGENHLFLFRTKVEALEASSYLSKEAVPHRLRFGGLPNTVAPWVASALVSIAKPDFSEADFARVMPELQSLPAFVGWDGETAWRALRRIGADGRTRVRCSAISANIASGRRLEELSVREVGGRGPILSTIHGSKGREADVVFACLSDSGREEEDSASEGRVLYVAASRAKREIVFRRARRGRWAYDKSGRAWSRLSRGLQVEFGQQGDVDVLRSVVFPGEDARVMQAQLQASAGALVDCIAHCLKREEKWFWPIKHREGDVIVGALSRQMEETLRRIGRAPKSVAYLYQMEVTTAAASAEQLNRAGVTLPEPWRTVGVWLAPVVAGLSFVSVGRKK